MPVEQNQGRFVLRETLLSAVTATNNGTWTRCHKMHPFTVVVSGSFSGTAKVYVSNDATQPTASDHNYPQLGDDITSVGVVHSDGPYEWVKVRVSAYTSGTCNANLAAANNAPARG